VIRLRSVALLLLLLVCGRVLAQESTVTLRGNYWRDRNTRVVQPTIEVLKATSTGTQIGAHYLLDTITSASVAAGVLRDQPFTELRNEAGFSIGQAFGPALITAAYSYSSESDYWAHFVSLGFALSLFDRNTILSGGLGYGHNTVGQRQGANVYNVVGGLETVNANLNLTQLFTPTLLGTASYEVIDLGFGTPQNGFQANPYRSVNLGGSPSREQVPLQRIRQSVAASVHWLIPTGIRMMPYLAFRPSYRFYFDDWGVTSHTPELRIFIPVGFAEWRVSARYYTQGQASFYNDIDGVPSYPTGMGLHCTTCFNAGVRSGLYFTSDPKLSAFSAEFLELRLLFHLDGLHRLRIPGALWLSSGIFEISYGHYFNGGYAHRAFGDSEVAGMTMSWPL
jgi:hypothetical protein